MLRSPARCSRRRPRLAATDALVREPLRLDGRAGDTADDGAHRGRDEGAFPPRLLDVVTRELTSVEARLRLRGSPAPSSVLSYASFPHPSSPAGSLRVTWKNRLTHPAALCHRNGFLYSAGRVVVKPINADRRPRGSGQSRRSRAVAVPSVRGVPVAAGAAPSVAVELGETVAMIGGSAEGHSGRPVHA